jgi:hypothetical protein
MALIQQLPASEFSCSTCFLSRSLGRYPLILSRALCCFDRSGTFEGFDLYVRDSSLQLIESGNVGELDCCRTQRRVYWAGFRSRNL